MEDDSTPEDGEGEGVLESSSYPIKQFTIKH